MSTHITDPTELEAWVRARADEVAREVGCRLLEVELTLAGRKTRVEVVVDRAEGVGVEDCARVSRELGSRLDAADVFEHSYTLEVGSPGLTRPLKRPSDYDTFRGRLARLELRSPVDGRSSLRGVLGGLNAARDSALLEDAAGGRAWEVPLALIAAARLDFDPLPSPAAQPQRVRR